MTSYRGSDHRRRQHQSASPKKRTGPERQYLDRDVRLLSSTAVDETHHRVHPAGRPLSLTSPARSGHGSAVTTSPAPKAPRRRRAGGRGKPQRQTNPVKRAYHRRVPRLLPKTGCGHSAPRRRACGARVARPDDIGERRRPARRVPVDDPASEPPRRAGRGSTRSRLKMISVGQHRGNSRPENTRRLPNVSNARSPANSRAPATTIDRQRPSARPVTAEVAGSSPVGVAIGNRQARRPPDRRRPPDSAEHPPNGRARHRGGTVPGLRGSGEPASLRPVSLPARQSGAGVAGPGRRLGRLGRLGRLRRPGRGRRTARRGRRTTGGRRRSARGRR